ncbi:MAG: aspartate 1-decarboxylase [Verrucomicrobiales bacterium]|nr:aspartate 1-decarboxylase [Verrucomicrobiales bacterium]
MRSLLRSKIHLATITEANLDYIGSITIDSELLEAVDLWPGEKVLIVNQTTGVRLETYVIKGDAGSGAIEINGAAAHLVNPGEKIIIMGFELASKPIEPKVILVDEDNRIERFLTEKAAATLDMV